MWWIEKIKTHCWNAIAAGAQLHIDIPPVFNTCLMHVRDVHEWQKEDITGPYVCCSHEALTGPRPETLPLESDAYQSLRKIVLTKTFQRDLAKASPHGGTSICETKNALDRPISTYPMYVKLATMHLNTLRLAEIAGERREVRVLEIQRKYYRRKSRISFKNPVPHIWRDEILEEVMHSRRLMLDSNTVESDDLHVSEDVRELMDEEDIFSAEL
ncbi:hypothetical protein OESDEN_00335 [Oesophagostomum dentatum]|uniref:Uncharacterized protein n=1 Tax=Oesophagostomum dentatum TaxID=61180 RepID=A0A0B1TU97_OESDE|nr:hypothetical protein OESDEN_00335 [Oesophagostomum dentatum]